MTLGEAQQSKTQEAMVTSPNSQLAANTYELVRIVTNASSILLK